MPPISVCSGDDSGRAASNSHVNISDRAAPGEPTGGLDSAKLVKKKTWKVSRKLDLDQTDAV